MSDLGQKRDQDLVRDLRPDFVLRMGVVGGSFTEITPSHRVRCEADIYLAFDSVAAAADTMLRAYAPYFRSEKPELRACFLLPALEDTRWRQAARGAGFAVEVLLPAAPDQLLNQLPPEGRRSLEQALSEAVSVTVIAPDAFGAATDETGLPATPLTMARLLGRRSDLVLALQPQPLAPLAEKVRALAAARERGRPRLLLPVAGGALQLHVNGAAPVSLPSPDVGRDRIAQALEPWFAPPGAVAEVTNLRSAASKNDDPAARAMNPKERELSICLNAINDFRVNLDPLLAAAPGLTAQEANVLVPMRALVGARTTDKVTAPPPARARFALIAALAFGVIAPVLAVMLSRGLPDTLPGFVGLIAVIMLWGFGLTQLDRRWRVVLPGGSQLAQLEMVSVLSRIGLDVFDGHDGPPGSLKDWQIAMLQRRLGLPDVSIDARYVEAVALRAQTLAAAERKRLEERSRHMVGLRSLAAFGSCLCLLGLLAVSGGMLAGLSVLKGADLALVICILGLWAVIGLAIATSLKFDMPERLAEIADIDAGLAREGERLDALEDHVLHLQKLRLGDAAKPPRQRLFAQGLD